MSCDLAVLNAKVITMDPSKKVAEAFAIRDGMIVKVGRDEEILPMTGPRTEVLRLSREIVTPGLIDTHTHFSPEAVSQKHELDLRYPNVSSIKMITERVREAAKASKKGEWIRGRGWSASYLQEKRSVTKRDLDPVAPDNPVVLVDAGWHTVSVNTSALAVAGIDKNTVIEGGVIEKDEMGEPNGLLHEKAANRLREHVPFWNQEEVASCIARAQIQFISEGVTCIKDACNAGIEETCFEAYKSLLAKNELFFRVCMLCNVPPVRGLTAALNLREENVADRLWVSGVKLFMDGGGAGNIWLWDDFSVDYGRVDKGNKGYPVMDLAEYRELVEEAASKGLDVHTHAVGDRAIDEVVGIYSHVAAGSRKNIRLSVVHCYLPTEQAIRKMARSKGRIVVETQPAAMYFNGDSMASYLGSKRSKRVIPLRSMRRKGITVGFGSDWAGTPPAARYSIWSSMKRMPRKGLFGFGVFGAGERVSRGDALRCLTILAAKCLGVEDRLGSIEAGKLGDFVVWKTKIDTCSSDELKDAKVKSVFVGGRKVYPAP